MEFLSALPVIGIFGALGTLLAATVIIGVLTALFLRRVVPTNMVHIVQTTRKTTSYGRNRPAGNTYYAWPTWFPVIGITVVTMPESVFQVKLTDYEAYDSARLPFMVDVSAFFRISDSDTAAQRVFSFAELNEQLQAVLQGAVRRILATNPLEEIMQQRALLGKQFTSEVDENIKEWGVCTVKMIEFMDLRDSKQSSSKVIANIMAKEQARIDQESRVKVAEHDRSATIAEIEAQRQKDLSAQEAEQQVGIRTAEKVKTVGIQNEKAKQDIQEQAKLTAEREMDVKRVRDTKAAEIAKTVAETEAMQNKSVAITQAEQNKSVAITEAEGTKTSTQTRAEGDLFAQLKEAEGIAAKGRADGEAQKAVLMAPVEAQIALAEKIASSDGYQKYLVTIRQVEATEAVGKELAGALGKADIKIVSGGAGGNLMADTNGILGLFTPQGGMSLAGMATALAATPEGSALLEKVTGSNAKASTNPLKK